MTNITEEPDLVMERTAFCSHSSHHRDSSSPEALHSARTQGLSNRDKPSQVSLIPVRCVS